LINAKLITYIPSITVIQPKPRGKIQQVSMRPEALIPAIGGNMVIQQVDLTKRCLEFPVFSHADLV
jgi:hypothetical protein